MTLSGYNDTKESHGRHVGCVDLLNAVQLRVKPKYHIFGQIHEGELSFNVVVRGAWALSRDRADVIA